MEDFNASQMKKLSISIRDSKIEQAIEYIKERVTVAAEKGTRCHLVLGEEYKAFVSPIANWLETRGFRVRYSDIPGGERTSITIDWE